ncbi:lysylphosphatidylglycerol synthase domain-containing protein [Burkholderia pseudomallei]
MASAARQRASLPFLWWIATVREAVNRLLPVVGVGGEIVGIRLARWRVPDASRVTASVIVEVLVTIAVQYAFAALGLVLLLAATQESVGARTIGVALALSLPIPVLGFVLMRRGGVFHAIERFAGRLLGDSHRLLQGVDGKRLDADIDALMSRAGLLFRAFFWQLAGYVAGALEIYWALALLGHPISIGGAIAIEAMTQAVRHAAFMVPGGLGVQEATVVLLAQMFGVDREAALSLALVKRARSCCSARLRSDRGRSSSCRARGGGFAATRGERPASRRPRRGASARRSRRCERAAGPPGACFRALIRRSGRIELEARSSKLEARSSKLEARSSKLEARSSKLEARSSKLEARSSKLEARSSKLEARRSSKLEARSSKLEARSSKLRGARAQKFKGPDPCVPGHALGGAHAATRSSAFRFSLSPAAGALRFGHCEAPTAARAGDATPVETCTSSDSLAGRAASVSASWRLPRGALALALARAGLAWAAWRQP